MKNRITDLRRQQALTQAMLAEKLGVSRQTVISLENGRYSPSLALAHKLALVFEMTIEDIFIFEED